MTASLRVKVTHTFSAQTREQVRRLVESGVVKDASSFIEDAVQAALQQHKWQQLELELQAFEDDSYRAAAGAVGESDIGDVAAELHTGLGHA